MKKEDISKALNSINEQYIYEAHNYTTNIKSVKYSKKPFIRIAIAAVIILCFVAGGIHMFFPVNNLNIKAYAYGTDEEIVPAGVVLDTGTISDSGEMKGIPLMFYLSGRGIESVRFSCKNQQLQFRDWTEKRDEFGSAQNFTVPYGSDESEYYYLTVDWEPNDTIRELTDNDNSTIKTLPSELKEDIIVMEITFINGKKAVKAIFVSILDDGRLFAKYDDYKISDTDDFVKRTDALTLRELSKIKEEQIKEENNKESTANPAAVEAAREYYSGSVFEVISMEEVSCTKNKIIFSVCVSKDGVIQDPDRRITLKLKDGIWKVVGEGY